MAKGLDISCFQNVTDHSKQLSFQVVSEDVVDFVAALAV